MFRSVGGATGKPGGQSHRHAPELPVRMQDQHGLPHGPVSLPHLLGQQEKDSPNGAGRACRIRPSWIRSPRKWERMSWWSRRASWDRSRSIPPPCWVLVLVVFVIRKYSRKEAAVAALAGAAGRSAPRSLSRPNRKGSGKARLMVLSAAVVLAMGTILFTLFVRSPGRSRGARLSRPRRIWRSAKPRSTKTCAISSLSSASASFRTPITRRPKWICSANWRRCWRKSMRCAASCPLQPAQATSAQGQAGIRQDCPHCGAKFAATYEILRRMRKGDVVMRCMRFALLLAIASCLRRRRRRDRQRHHGPAGAEHDRLADPAHAGGHADARHHQERRARQIQFR